ncbi:MAG: hypothetical protein JXQ75_05240 [Phycisphaerae bacterium]|nr:hypothetical protein [Phycisphaerae bacterium]
MCSTTAAPRPPVITDWSDLATSDTDCRPPFDSYGFNRCLSGRSYDGFTGLARYPVVFDSVSEKISPAHFDQPPEYDGGCWVYRGGRDHLKPACIMRHQVSVNVLFLEWSIRAVGLKELWTLPWHDECDTAGPWTEAGGVLPQDWPPWLRKFEDYWSWPVTFGP